MSLKYEPSSELQVTGVVIMWLTPLVPFTRGEIFFFITLKPRVE